MSLPGVRNIFASGQHMRHNFDYTRSSIPELQRLYAFIMYADFPWTDQFGHPASRIQKATWVSHGIKRTRSGGYRMGR